MLSLETTYKQNCTYLRTTRGDQFAVIHYICTYYLKGYLEWQWLIMWAIVCSKCSLIPIPFLCVTVVYQFNSSDRNSSSSDGFYSLSLLLCNSVTDTTYYNTTSAVMSRVVSEVKTIYLLGQHLPLVTGAQECKECCSHEATHWCNTCVSLLPAL